MERLDALARDIRWSFIKMLSNWVESLMKLGRGLHATQDPTGNISPYSLFCWFVSKSSKSKPSVCP